MSGNRMLQPELEPEPEIRLVRRFPAQDRAPASAPPSQAPAAPAREAAPRNPQPPAAKAPSPAPPAADPPPQKLRTSTFGAEFTLETRAPLVEPETDRSHAHWLLWAMLVSLLIVWGSHAHLERYITPDRGLGYALGIVGGSMMLALLIYSARKRYRWLAWMGGVPGWFRIHMTLGVVGPLLVLFHANFSLGATNSNVALISMLLVAGSGVIGRYIYTRIHEHLDGKEETLDDLQSISERIRKQSTQVHFLPGLLDAIDAAEKAVVQPSAGPIGRFLHLFTTGPRAALARWRIHRLIGRTIAEAVREPGSELAAHAPMIGRVARKYADRRINAARRVAEYRMYAQLFSLWHVLHIPLFFMLLIAALVHVVAVNLY